MTDATPAARVIARYRAEVFVLVPDATAARPRGPGALVGPLAAVAVRQTRSEPAPPMPPRPHGGRATPARTPHPSD